MTARHAKSKGPSPVSYIPDPEPEWISNLLISEACRILWGRWAPALVTQLLGYPPEEEGFFRHRLSLLPKVLEATVHRDLEYLDDRRLEGGSRPSLFYVTQGRQIAQTLAAILRVPILSDAFWPRQKGGLG